MSLEVQMESDVKKRDQGMRDRSEETACSAWLAVSLSTVLVTPVLISSNCSTLSIGNIQTIKLQQTHYIIQTSSDRRLCYLNQNIRMILIKK